MAKSACKCKKAAECEECPEWIFTFADLVMLMMGFFVILWVLKPAPGKNSPDQAVDEKWLEVVEKIREAFGRMPDPESHDPVDVQAIMKKVEQLDPSNKGPGKGGETKEPRQGAQGTDPLVMNVRPGTHVSVGGKLLFDPGDAKLTPATQKTLDEIARLIKGHRNIIVVKGHASLDDVPDRSGVADASKEQSLMMLSIKRADAAASYLISKGLSPDVVRVEGCSTHEPVVQKVYTPNSQILNRRVEVEATDTLVRERQDRDAPTTVPVLSTAPPTDLPADAN